MNPFRAYDIRGEYPNELNSELAVRIAKAYCKFLKPKTIMVGYDARDSSPKLCDAVVKGLKSQNVKVTSIGLVTTPMFYFGLNTHEVDGGIMITSSHSPLNTNGLKLCSRKAQSLHIENGLKEIERLSYLSIKDKNKGKLKKHKIFKEYYRFIKKYPKKSKLKIGVDGSNMCGVLDYKILKKLYKVKGINVKLGAKKPYFSPNPLIASNLSNIKHLVKEKRLDLGIFLDGDCDRVMFIDEKGNEIAADIVAALLIDKYKYKKILKDSQSTKMIDEVCKKNHTKLIQTRIGHSFVDTKLKQTGSEFGSERSGHYYYKDFFFKDNALLTAIRLINIIDKPVSKLVAPYKKYFHSGELNFRVIDKKGLIKALEKEYHGYKISHFDGLTITTPGYWFYIRISNTQNLVRLYIESKNFKELEKIKLKLTKFIKGHRKKRNV